MLSDMDMESGLLRIAHPADLALVGLFLIMVNHVCLKMSFSNKGKSTLRIFALEGSFIGLKDEK